MTEAKYFGGKVLRFDGEGSGGRLGANESSSPNRRRIGRPKKKEDEAERLGVACARYSVTFVKVEKDARLSSSLESSLISTSHARLSKVSAARPLLFRSRVFAPPISRRLTARGGCALTDSKLDRDDRTIRGKLPGS
jgi:hypothetical protein